MADGIEFIVAPESIFKKVSKFNDELKFNFEIFGSIVFPEVKGFLWKAWVGLSQKRNPTIATKCGRNHFSWSVRTRLKENGIKYSIYPKCISNFTKNEKGSEW